MSRKLVIAGNWKMNHNQAASRELLAVLKENLSDVNDIEIIVCPVFTSLETAVDICKGSNISVGAQNLHWAEDGAFTGEISADMLLEINVTYVIIGHSERRQYFNETDATVNQRLKAALAAGLKPIVCVGETIEERRSGDTENVVGRQLAGALEGISESEMANIIIAYEPVWAIGTGETASPEQAQDVHAFVAVEVTAGAETAGECAYGIGDPPNRGTTMRMTLPLARD